jgi:hypothetical protein
MDDLDRLYFEFVEVARRERGGAMAEPLTVLELHDELIPYRRVRDPADLRSNDDYELALSRMLAGERGYLLSDGNMQDELRAGLEETLPDIRRYRAFPDARVRLNPDEVPPPGHTRYAPPEMRERVEWSAPSVEADAALPDSQPEKASVVEDRVEEEEYIEEAELDDVVLEDETPGFDPGPLEPVQDSELTEEEAGVPEPSVVADPGAESEVCPSCGTDSPVAAAFCPFCGTRLSPQSCEACGAELESAWLFCAACGAPRPGRSADPA